MVEDLLKELRVFCRATSFIFLTLLLFLISSCAKLGYVWEQGIGQLSIQCSAIPNDKVLADPQINEDIKNKIRAIIKAKAFFEKLYNIKFDDIYEKTTFLEREAVSYMVTASPINEVKPYRVSFPLVGEFPYLAFFKKKSAESFARKLEKKDLVTWMRPVQAYSSLNYFDDRILSSFFVFSELELAELVFHELTHLTLFVKNNVGFNESLAQFVAHKTLEIYLKDHSESFLKKRQLSRNLAKDLVPLIKKLNKRYKEQPELDPNEVRKDFLKTSIFPRFQVYCDESGVQCKLDEGNWNNARMVGYLNYEQTYERIEKSYQSQNSGIVQFVVNLKKIYEDYNKLNDDAVSFLEFLEKSK